MITVIPRKITATSVNGVAVANDGSITLPVDSAPTTNSTNLVTSGGVFDALAEKQGTLTFDTTPTSGSTNPVTSGGLYTEAGNLAAGMAILANNNTHAAIASGQYVYVRGHGSLSEGLYMATASIAANGTLSTSNLTAVSGGGLNALNSDIAVMPKRIVGFIRPGESIQIFLSSIYSVNAEFALLTLNVDGNSIAGTALMFLGRGTSKYKDLIGSMDATFYSLSYENYVWTLTNNTPSSNMYYTCITSM